MFDTRIISATSATVRKRMSENAPAMSAPAVACDWCCWCE
jgi:hypothetical protein